MSLNPRQIQAMFQRIQFSTISRNSLYNHKKTNTQVSSDRLAKSIHTQAYLHTDKSQKVLRKQESHKTLKLGGGNTKNQDVIHLRQFNRKLLQEVQGHRRQVQNLQKEVARLQKKMKDTQKQNQILKIRLSNQDNQSECQAPIRFYYNDKQKCQEDTQILDTPRTDFDPQTDMRMIISRYVPQDYESRQTQKLKIIELQKQNQILKSCIQNLEVQLKQNHNQSVVTLAPSKIINQQSTQTHFVSILLQTNKQNIKTDREIQLQNKVEKLEQHIRDMNSHHSKLKDRCSTIRHLITKVK